MKFIVKGQLLPRPETYAGINPILYWIRYFFTGAPLPAGGWDIIISPIAWAGWAGLLVTSLNLIPAGQLDGGHIMYVLLGKRTTKLLPFILVALVLLGFAWSGWWLWAALIFLLGRMHAEPLDQITPLDPKRRALAIFGVIVIHLCLHPRSADLAVRFNQPKSCSSRRRFLLPSTKVVFLDVFNIER